jgi:hypothetical protein
MTSALLDAPQSLAVRPRTNCLKAGFVSGAMPSIRTAWGVQQENRRRPAAIHSWKPLRYNVLLNVDGDLLPGRRVAAPPDLVDEELRKLILEAGRLLLTPDGLLDCALNRQLSSEIKMAEW